MNIAQLFNFIESSTFDAIAGLASGYQSFCRIVTRHETFRSLVDTLAENPSQKERVIARVAALAKQEVNQNYLNPADTALATYIHLLSLVDLELAQVAALFASNAKNCHWAEITSRYLLSFAKVEEVKSKALSVQQQSPTTSQRYASTASSSFVHLSFEALRESKVSAFSVVVPKQGKTKETRRFFSQQPRLHVLSSPRHATQYTIATFQAS